MLNNGQNVFVPQYGAGILSDVKDSENYDINKKYKNISMILNNIDLYIPEDRLKDYRIRNIESKEILEQALQVIKSEPSNIEKKWSKRYRRNNEKINGGSLFEICEVIRDLYYLKRKGTIPPGEKKILIKAEYMLASEITLILSTNIEDALIIIRNLSE